MCQTLITLHMLQTGLVHFIYGFCPRNFKYSSYPTPFTLPSPSAVSSLASNRILKKLKDGEWDSLCTGADLGINRHFPAKWRGVARGKVLINIWFRGGIFQVPRSACISKSEGFWWRGCRKAGNEWAFSHYYVFPPTFWIAVFDYFARAFASGFFCCMKSSGKLNFLYLSRVLRGSVSCHRTTTEHSV